MCHFIPKHKKDECPLIPTEMLPPPIGSMVFIEGEPAWWRVVDLQYQFRRPTMELILVNVIIEWDGRRK
jgi:hypothetical protein